MADELNDAEDAVVEAEKLLVEAEKAADKARQDADVARALRDTAILERDGKPHPHQDQLDRMAYIQSQADQRAGRFRRAAKVREEVSDPEALEPRAPIDKAMSRKTGHGNRARPQRKTKAE